MKKDSVKGQYAFKVMTELCDIGSRVVGSDGEVDAADYIEKLFIDLGLHNVQHHRHDIEYYDAKNAFVEFLNSGERVKGVPCWMSAATPLEGVTGEGLYIGGAANVEGLSKEVVSGKVVFVLLTRQYGNDILQAWKDLYAMEPAGVVFLDRERTRAPRTYMYTPLNKTFERLPCMIALAEDITELRENMTGVRVRLVVDGSPERGKLHNISSEIPGEKTKTILVCAHHDTHYLTPGATDNAAGVAVMMELAKNLSKAQNKFTFRFVSFGGEELEMQGSRKYVSSTDISDVILCINFDSIGAMPGILMVLAAGNERMIERLTEIAKSNLYPANCRRAATSGGDNIVFAAEGIPTIHFALLGTTSEKVSHSPADVPDLLTKKELVEMGILAHRVIDKIEKTEDWPTEKEMPEDLLEAAKQRLG